MKKLIPALALAIVMTGLQSCKKENQAADQLVSSSDSTANLTSVAGTQAPASAATEELAVKEATSNQPLTNLALSDSQFDFGDIKKGKTVEHVYEVTNTGKNPLIISSVKPGCGCTAPDYTKDPILPGKKGTITLKFDSSSFDGPIHKQAEVFANVEKAPIVIGFSGNVVQ